MAESKKEEVKEKKEKKEYVFCEHCGAKIVKGAEFCKECGKLTAKKEETESTEDNEKLMSVLAYIIAPIPYFVSKDNKEIQYHARQGMNLFCVGVIWGIISILLSSLIKVRKSCYFGWGYCPVTPWWVTTIVWLGSLAITALAVIGIVNVINGKKKKLPLLGNIEIFK